MTKENKLFILQILILVTLGVFIFLFLHHKSNEPSFTDAFKDSNKRLDSIQHEIIKSQLLITKTQTQLDSIEAHVKVIKGEQAASNDVVAANDSIMQHKLIVQEAQLRNLKTQYNAVQRDKKLLSNKLDSINIRIQSDN
jgi:chromosome segregation ATPase